MSDFNVPDSRPNKNTMKFRKSTVDKWFPLSHAMHSHGGLALQNGARCGAALFGSPKRSSVKGDLHWLRATMLALMKLSTCLATPELGHAARFRRHQPCDFREHATSAPAELGGEIHNVSRNRAHTQVLLRARKSHLCGSGTFGAFRRWRAPPSPAMTIPYYAILYYTTLHYHLI